MKSIFFEKKPFEPFKMNLQETEGQKYAGGSRLSWYLLPS